MRILLLFMSLVVCTGETFAQNRSGRERKIRSYLSCSQTDTSAAVCLLEQELVYDKRGLLMMEAVPSDSCPGTLDTFLFSYDQRKRPTSTVWMRSGKPILIQQCSYAKNTEKITDAYGNQLTITRRFSRKGQPTYSCTETAHQRTTEVFVYDKRDRIILHRRTTWMTDYPDSVYSDRRVSRIYGAKGERLEVTRDVSHASGMFIDSSWYSAKGRPVRRMFTFGVPGGSMQRLLVDSVSVVSTSTGTQEIHYTGFQRAYPGTPLSKLVVSRILTYDLNDSLTCEITYRTDTYHTWEKGWYELTRPIWREEYERGSTGKVTKYTYCSLSGCGLSDTIPDRIKWYDAEGRLIREKDYAGETTFRYSEEGWLLELVCRNPSGNESWRETFVYDDEGNNVEVCYETEGTRMVHYIEYY